MHSIYSSGNKPAEGESSQDSLGQGEAAPAGGPQFPACQATRLPSDISTQLLSWERALHAGRRIASLPPSSLVCTVRPIHLEEVRI